METDKIHFLTDAIYRNLLDNYSPGLKQFINAGRAYQKALHNVTAVGKNYIECIFNLSQSAQVCKGATSEIGAALLQIAEVLKEINNQILDNIKSFHAELLIPLESKQDSELKQLQVLHKKYQSGHKFHASALDKSNAALKKHKKKAKAKYGYDQKEVQHNRDVKEKQSQLEEYQLTCLKTVLIEERKRYCKLLTHVCGAVHTQATHHSKSHELLTHRLTEWQDKCQNPHFLPEASEAVIRAFKVQQEDVYSTTDELAEFGRRGSIDYGATTRGGESVSLTYGTMHRMGPDGRGYDHANHNEDFPGSGLTRSVSVAANANRIQVRAVYSYQPSSSGSSSVDTSTQLSFQAGDMITIVSGGARHGGWQYGENTRTGDVGWFPLAFTEQIHNGNMDHNNSSNQRMFGHQRVKSMGNLQELTGDDYQRSYPRSEPAAPATPHHSSRYSDSDSGHGRDFERPKSMLMMHSNNMSSNMDGARTPTTPSKVTHSSTLPNMTPPQHTYPPRPLDPDLPPPPPPLISPQQQHPPPPPNRPPPPPHTPRPLHHAHSSHALVGQPQDYSPQTTRIQTTSTATTIGLSPANSSSGYSSSVNMTPGGGPPVPPPLQQQYNGLSPQQMQQQHNGPPPPPKLPPPQPPPWNYDSPHSNSNPFSTVKLKKTVTNDRSAPRIK